MIPSIGSPVTKNKSSLKKMINKMSPEVRDEFLKDAKQSERSASIRQKENGRFCVDLYISETKDGEYNSANADKEFDSFDAADKFLEKFFEENPDMSEIDDLEY